MVRTAAGLTIYSPSPCCIAHACHVQQNNACKTCMTCICYMHHVGSAFRQGQCVVTQPCGRAAVSSDPLPIERMTRGCPLCRTRTATRGGCGLSDRDGVTMQVVAQLQGERNLPWEGARCGPQLHRLGALRSAVLHLLERNPVQRSTAREFHTACSEAFSGHAGLGL